MKKLVLVLVVLLISGCALVAPTRITDADKRGEFHEGMSFSEVARIAGRGVSSYDDYYSEEVVGGNVYKTWRIHGKSVTPINTIRIYEFKFKDDKLVSWSWDK
jgi:hypothetical protein